LNLDEHNLLKIKINYNKLLLIFISMLLYLDTLINLVSVDGSKP
jgi:hypothetical protein